MNRTIFIVAALGFIGLATVALALSALVDVKPPTPQGVVRGTPHEEAIEIAKERAKPSKQVGGKAVVATLADHSGMLEPSS